MFTLVRKLYSSSCEIFYIGRNYLIYRPDWLVGVEGFEPPTLWSQTRCATKLRYTPIIGRCFLSIIKFLLYGALFMATTFSTASNNTTTLLIVNGYFCGPGLLNDEYLVLCACGRAIVFHVLMYSELRYGLEVTH